jgi:hypothetical protein
VKRAQQAADKAAQLGHDGDMINAVNGSSLQQQQYNGNLPTSMSTNINPQLANYNMSQNQNGVPMFNGQSTTASSRA